jgi:hypothetical protein
MDKYELRRQKLSELMNEQCDGKVSSLAKRLGRSDSYVARMLYPPDKPGFKRIGEDMADVIAQTFNLDRRSLDRAVEPEVSSMELQWVSANEAALLSMYRATDAEGQDSVFKLAEIVRKVKVLPAASSTVIHHKR